MTKQRFSQEFNMPLDLVIKLSRLANKAAKINTHSCNGDSHPKADPTDKNACSLLWDKELDKITQKITKLVQPYGFTVEYNGLYPSLTKDGNTVFIP